MTTMLIMMGTPPRVDIVQLNSRRPGTAHACSGKRR